MKLAVALQERKDLNEKINQLSYRLNMNSIVQEGESSQENPEDLLKELDECLKELEHLICRINITNCNTLTNYNNLTLTDMLTLKINKYRDLVNNASNLISRVSRSEIKVISNVDVKKTQKQIDLMSKELRIIENTIQETNWLIELQ